MTITIHACKCLLIVLVKQSNPGCPFAHRAHMTMLQKGIDHEFVLIPLSGELTKIKANGPEACLPWSSSGKTYEEIQQIKDSYKADINATGEVPTLVCKTSDGDKVISEADVVSEFLDDAFPESGTKLLPNDPFQRATTRHYLKILSGGTGVMACYILLKNQDPEQDEAKRAKLYQGLESFSKMADPEGPFFLGSEISLADIMLAPYYDRYRFALKTYRDVDFIPTDFEAYPWAARMAKWAAAIEATESFQKSQSTQQHYIDSYLSYAGDRGASKFGA